MIDKATIDSMLCKGDEGRNDALCVINEVYRVLKPGGNRDQCVRTKFE